jgi:hypothetical protein
MNKFKKLDDDFESGPSQLLLQCDFINKMQFFSSTGFIEYDVSTFSSYDGKFKMVCKK